MADNDNNPVLTAVAVTMSVLAIIATIVMLLVMWHMGDLVWPFGPLNHSVPPCLPGEHCLP